MTNLVQHSTCVLDISDDEGKSQDGRWGEGEHSTRRTGRSRHETMVKKKATMRVTTVKILPFVGLKCAFSIARASPRLGTGRFGIELSPKPLPPDPSIREIFFVFH
jgi:hypothetical protein